MTHKKYELTKITCRIELLAILDYDKSIFWKFRLFPTAFIRHWSYARLMMELDSGNFYFHKLKKAL